MDDIIRQINQAVYDLEIHSDSLQECSKEKSAEVVNEAKQRFVKGNPRSWWLSLKVTPVIIGSSKNGVNEVRRYIPVLEGKFWFIPEVDDSDLTVFDVTLDAVVSVLKECSFFEYYLIGKDMSWLLIENDHNQIIIVEIG